MKSDSRTILLGYYAIMLYIHGIIFLVFQSIQFWIEWVSEYKNTCHIVGIKSVFFISVLWLHSPLWQGTRFHFHLLHSLPLFTMHGSFSIGGFHPRLISESVQQYGACVSSWLLGSQSLFFHWKKNHRQRFITNHLHHLLIKPRYNFSLHFMNSRLKFKGTPDLFFSIF